MPEEKLPTVIAAVSHEHLSSEELAVRLRLFSPSIITRQKDDKVYLDFRTITDEELSFLIDGFQSIL